MDFSDLKNKTDQELIVICNMYMFGTELEQAFSKEESAYILSRVEHLLPKTVTEKIEIEAE